MVADSVGCWVLRMVVPLADWKVVYSAAGLAALTERYWAGDLVIPMAEL